MTAPADVGYLVAASLEAFFATAEGHLGDARPDGSRVALPDPQEAYLALLAASSLVDQLCHVMAPALHQTYATRLERLLALYEARHPGPHAEAPAPVASLADLEARAWADLT